MRDRGTILALVSTVATCGVLVVGFRRIAREVAGLAGRVANSQEAYRLGTQRRHLDGGDSRELRIVR